MAHNIYVDINLNGNQLIDVQVEQLAADPSGGGLYSGRFWFNTTANVLKYYDGAAIQVVASQNYVVSQLNNLGQIQGGFSALAGALPTSADKTQGDLTAIKKGDNWTVTVAGTIAGIGGADELSVGDVLQFFGSNPATAADWLGIQRNLNDALIGDITGEKQTVNLVANIALNVNAAVLTNIHTIQVYDSAGALIVVDIQKLGGANQRTLTSKKALTNVSVEFTGIK